MGEGLICQLDWWLQLNPQWQKKNVFPTDGSAWKEGAVINCCLLEEEMEFCSEILDSGVSILHELTQTTNISFPPKQQCRKICLPFIVNGSTRVIWPALGSSSQPRTNTVFRMTIVPFWKKKTNNNGSITHLNETRVHISGTVGDSHSKNIEPGSPFHILHRAATQCAA